MGTEASRYEAPRILSMGYRGFDVASTGQIVLEVEVAGSPLHPGDAIEVFPDDSDLPIGLPMTPLADRGGGIFTSTHSAAGIPAGRYVVHAFPRSVGATSLDGDHAPQLLLHLYPGWDVDEPASLPGSCFEPSEW